IIPGEAECPVNERLPRSPGTVENPHGGITILFPILAVAVCLRAHAGNFFPAGRLGHQLVGVTGVARHIQDAGLVGDVLDHDAAVIAAKAWLWWFGFRLAREFVLTDHEASLLLFPFTKHALDSSLVKEHASLFGDLRRR